MRWGIYQYQRRVYGYATVSGLVCYLACVTCPVLTGQLVVMTYRCSHGGCYGLHLTVVHLCIKHPQSHKAKPHQVTSDCFLVMKNASDLLVTSTGGTRSGDHMLACHGACSFRRLNNF